MHEVADFAEHCLGLLENTRPTCPTCPDSKKPLKLQAKVGTFGAQGLGHVTENLSQANISTCTGITKQKQTLTENGTCGTPVTSNLDWSGGELHAKDAPAEWHAILAELERRSCPDWLPPDRWNSVLADAENFLTRWGAAAHSLGWTALDLFGVHSLAPGARVGWWGLLLLIRGGEVVVLTDSAATIRHLSNAVLTFKREHQSGRILLSELPL